MSERWVKATRANTTTVRLLDEMVWINMDYVSQIGHVDGAKIESTAESYVSMPGGDMWFKEPPEHFLPVDELANMRLFDALCRIKDLSKLGAHGSADIAAEAVDQWIAAREGQR